MINNYSSSEYGGSPVSSLQKTRNESLAESIGLSAADVEQIVNLPMDQFTSFAGEKNFSEDQMNILRDIRWIILSVSRAVSWNFAYIL